MSGSRDKDNGWGQLTRGAPLAVFVAAGLLILYRLLPILELLAVAILIALVFQTAFRLFLKIVKVRWLAILMLVGVFFAFGLFITFVVVPGFIEEAQVLNTKLPDYLNSLIRLSRRLHNSASFIPDLSQGLEQLKAIVNKVLGLLPQLLRYTVDLSLETVATLILAIYMAYDPNSLIQGIQRLIPRRQHKRYRRLLESTKLRLQGWIFGTGLAILIIGAGATIGLWILGVPLALSFGFLAGLLEIIPYVGSITGAVLPALVALTISPIKALFVLGLFLVLNQVDAHLVQPLVMSGRVHLHPVAVVLAFLVLGNLLGIIGVLLAVPIAAVIGAIIDELTAQDSPVQEEAKES